ncbi:MAG TPA: aspartyl protease family protein [Myxococcales bacterium]|nr:aspartyl protease family protein [Myxococcales bacterium]
MTSVPFDLVNDHVFVRASVEGKPADLIVDTGSSLSSLGESFAARAGISPMEGFATAAGAASVPVRLAQVHRLALQEVDLGEAVVVLVPVDQVSRAEGRPVDGSLGVDLFARHAVEIDYRSCALLLREPGTLQPGGGVPVAIDARRGIPLLEATLETREGTRIQARLAVDLGSSFLALRLSASFVERHGEAFAGLSGLEAALGTGVGGRLMGRVVRLRGLRLGDLSVAGPVAGLARERKGALETGLFDGTLGVPVFRPWAGIDYKAGRLFLHPEAGRESLYDASGLGLTSDQGGILIDSVASPSPASEMGLRPGDRLAKLDGRPLVPRDLHSLRQSLREAGATRVLEIERLGPVRIRLRTLV